MAEMGRPTKYSEEKADAICELIATSSKSMSKICDEVKISYRTHLYWLREHEDYLRKYTRAKEDQADYLADEIIEISDDSSQDVTLTADGKPVVNNEFIQRSRLRVDSRKFIASKLKPKKYGDRIEHTGNVDHGVVLRIIADDDTKADAIDAIG